MVVLKRGKRESYKTELKKTIKFGLWCDIIIFNRFENFVSFEPVILAPCKFVRERSARDSLISKAIARILISKFSIVYYLTRRWRHYYIHDHQRSSQFISRSLPGHSDVVCGSWNRVGSYSITAYCTMNWSREQIICIVTHNLWYVRRRRRSIVHYYRNKISSVCTMFKHHAL